MTYKNEPWHRDCFTCSNCNNSLAGQRFTSRNDKPYCAECFGELFAKRCTACSKPITGTYRSILLQKHSSPILLTCNMLILNDPCVFATQILKYWLIKQLFRHTWFEYFCLVWIDTPRARYSRLEHLIITLSQLMKQIRIYISIDGEFFEKKSIQAWRKVYTLK